jgi:hypothetical protein
MFAGRCDGSNSGVDYVLSGRLGCRSELLPLANILAGTRRLPWPGPTSPQESSSQVTSGAEDAAIAHFASIGNTDAPQEPAWSDLASRGALVQVLCACHIDSSRRKNDANFTIEGLTMKGSLCAGIAALMLYATAALAQETRNEISVQGTGFFTAGRA